MEENDAKIDKFSHKQNKDELITRNRRPLFTDRRRRTGEPGKRSFGRNQAAFHQSFPHKYLVIITRKSCEQKIFYIIVL